jgi:DNA-binding winged helix-turn-helix (wHTH) protein/tetratricopeptide (TPR) repeat protein
MSSTLPQRRTYCFGDFELQVNARLLTRDGKRVPLGSKAFEVLTCLVVHAGQVVTKEQLLRTVWPTSFVEESNLSQHVFALRKALGDRADLIVTVPGRGYQFTGAVRELAPPEPEAMEESETVVHTLRERSHVVIEEPYHLTPAAVEPVAPALPAANRRGPWLWGIGASIAVALLAFGGWEHFRHAPPNEVHTLMVADFQNTTGDDTFDRTLKRALEIELGQSPSLTVMGAGEAVSLLRLMGQKPDAALTGEVAREVCVRGNRQMLLTGTIATVGHAYLLTLEATECQSGRKLASAKAEAAGKDEVLGALDTIADRVRSKLGEPAKSHTSYEVPISEATTSSLEALKAYSMGEYLEAQGRDETQQISAYQRAVELDPNFAMAWGGMANAYYNLNEGVLASQTWQKAFDLSGRVSEREKLTLRAHYYGEGVNDMVEAVKAYRLWAETYPEDWPPLVNLCNGLTQIGQYSAAIPYCEEALRQRQDRGVAYSVLARALKCENRFEEAKAVSQKAIARGKDSTGLHSSLYEIAVIQQDAAAIERETRWAAEHSDSWYTWYFPYMQAAAAMREGRPREAEALFRQSSEGAERLQLLESLKDIAVDEATMELQLDRRDAARATLGRIGGSMPDSAELALEKAGFGDEAYAERFLAAHQAEEHPGTLRAFIKLPALRATLAIERGRPSDAIRALEGAAPYEMSSYLAPSLRALAYAKAGQPAQAAAEYRKVLENPGVDALSPLYPLAHLGLARAYAAAGRMPESRIEYRNFLEVWKNADPELPALKAARVELARLER